MYVHRSNQMEPLLDALVKVVARPQGDPFLPELIAVESRGLEHWLSMELAHRLGVWANPRFPFFGHLIKELFAIVLDLDEHNPFTQRVMQWSISALLPDLRATAPFAVLNNYLRDDPLGIKQAQISAQVADTFYSYLVFRPQMMLDWEAGEDEEDWQAILWRALVARHGSVHLAAQARAFAQAAEAIAAGERPRPDRLPDRVCVFGISAMPPLFLSMLKAIDGLTELHLFVLSPSQEYWADLRSERARRVRDPEVEVSVSLDESLFTDGPRMLAALGRLGRDFQGTLEEIAPDYEEDDDSLYVDPQLGTLGDSLLGVLQSDILHLARRRPRDTEDTGPTPLPFTEGDVSVGVHACHSAMREVEAVRDQILFALEQDPSLAPRDIVVMMPDVETYAPFIEAVFGGAGAPGTPGHLPYKITDRSFRSANKAVDAFSAIIDTLRSRMAASDVLDLLSIEPIRTRFMIGGEDMDRLRTWVAEAGIRWGINGDHRVEQGQPRFDENTWRFGLNRLLLGYAMAGEDRGAMFSGVLPFDDMEGADAALLGRFADFCESLFTLKSDLDALRSPAQWSDYLADLVERMIGHPHKNDWQRQVVRHIILDMGEEAVLAGFEQPVPLEVIQARLNAEFSEGREAFGYRQSGITFCALGPLRCVPFEVVCVMGMNDDAWPRMKRTLNFDRIAWKARLGDRTLRDSDRYAFLQALTCARRRLVITYTGRSIQDNTERPPSPVINELLDTLGESFDPPGVTTEGLRNALQAEQAREAIRGRVVVRHPLQPFSPRYFGAEADDPRMFSYRAADAAGARHVRGPRVPPPPFVPGLLVRAEEPLPGGAIGGSTPAEVPVLEVSLDDLTSFFAQPLRTLARRRLDINVRGREDALEDREPMEIRALARYQLGTRLLDAALAGQDLSALRDAMQGSGALPLGTVGHLAYERLVPEVLSVARAAAPYVGGADPLDDLPVDLRLNLGAGAEARLVGMLPDQWPKGQAKARFGRPSARHQLSQWVRHVVYSCAAPENRPRETALIGLSGGQASTVAFSAVEDSWACLADLLRLYRLGLTRPLRLFPRSGLAYAESFLKKKAKGATDDEAHDTALGGARKMMFDRFRSGEADDVHFQLILGTSDPLRPGVKLYPGEQDPSFSDLSLQVWSPLLAHREVR
ncbi:MAG: exodeoxyribonuclease V subunit gamma [Bradymonadia bacterium]